MELSHGGCPENDLAWAACRSTFEDRREHRRSTHLKLLNVLQGNDPPEADTWYNEVKQYDFDGWAFASQVANASTSASVPFRRTFSSNTRSVYGSRATSYAGCSSPTRKIR